MNQYGVVGITSMYGMVLGSNSGRDERLSAFLKSPGLLWGPLSHLFEGNVVPSWG